MLSDKDPQLVAAVHRGAQKRWRSPEGPVPRSAQMADLTPDERRLVLSLIDAARTRRNQTNEPPQAA